MLINRYQYLASFESPGGEPLGEQPLAVDWIPALRQAEYELGLVAGYPAERLRGPVLIEPRWSGPQPRIEGAAVHLGGADAPHIELSRDYFAEPVAAAALDLVARGALDPTDAVEYRLLARLDPAPPAPAGDNNYADGIAPVTAPPPVMEAALAPLLRRAGAPDLPSPAGGAPPVFIPDGLLKEADYLGRAAAGLETGGILLGRLCRDPGGSLFTRVTAQIPAQHTIATARSLRFTPATWVAAQAASSRRGRGEIVLGWWHCHPWFCGDCPPQRRAVCSFASPQFSAADRALHREVFQAPWSIGLLLSYLGGEGPSVDLFGWQRGRIDAVPFFTIAGELEDRGES